MRRAISGARRLRLCVPCYVGVDVDLTYVVEPPYYGTRIFLTAEMEDGRKYVDVYENRTFVEQKLKSAGWGK